MQSFRTRPDFEPPSVTVTTAKPGRAPGLVFLAPKAGRGQDGPMIIDDKGQMVWFKPMQGKLAADFRTQTYDGKPVLTWWEGRLYVGDGDGVGQIYDDTYKPVATVRTGNGYSYDLHELTITPRNTALVMAYERFERSLKAWGGPSEAKIVDNIIQEVDIKTGQVVFEWHSFGNVSPDESLIPVPKNRGSEWEYFHANAIDLDRDGNFLISARNTSTIYKVNRATGKIMWRLGGKKSDFKLGPGVRFDWQHSLRVLPNGDLRIYDNSAAPPVRKASRAITIRLDEQAKTGDARERLQAPAQPALRQPGQRRDAAQRQPVRRLGLAALVHRAQPDRRGALRRPHRPRQRQLPRVPLPVERQAVRSAARERDEQRRQGDGLRELERRDRRDPLGAPGRCERGGADADRLRGQGRLRDDAAR